MADEPRMLSTEDERSQLREIHKAVDGLPLPCIAAVVKHAMGILCDNNLVDEEYVTLGELDEITDQDPEL